MHGLGSLSLTFRSLFKQIINIITLLKKLHSNYWYGISIPLQSGLQCFLSWQIWRKYFQHGRELWELVRQVVHFYSDFLNTWTANFDHGIIFIIKPLVQQQVFLQSLASLHLDKHSSYTHLRLKHTFSWSH